MKTPLLSFILVFVSFSLSAQISAIDANRTYKSMVTLKTK